MRGEQYHPTTAPPHYHCKQQQCGHQDGAMPETECDHKSSNSSSNINCNIITRPNTVVSRPMGLLFLLCLLLVTCGNAVPTAGVSVNQAALQREVDSNDGHQQRQHRELITYALYNIPPLQITFKSKAGREFYEDDSGTGSEGLGVDDNSPTTGAVGQAASALSSLKYPLRTTSERVLLEFFQDNIEQFLEDSLVNSTDDPREIYSHLVSYDLTIETVNTIDTQRRLSSSLQDNNHRQLQTDVTVQAYLTGSIAFAEPHPHENKPSNSDVYDLFGDWLHSYFTLPAKKQDFWRALTRTSNKVLQEIIDLDVLVDPRTPRNSDNSSISNSSERPWYSGAALAILIVCILMIVTMALLSVLKYRVKMQRMKHLNYYDEHSDNGNESGVDLEYGESPRNGMSRGHFSQRSPSVFHDPDAFQDPRRQYENPGPLPDVSRPSLYRAGSLDAVRHGQYANYASSSQEALSILEASNRYLSKHRPEWLQMDSPTSAPQGTSTSNPAQYRPSAFSFYSPTSQQQQQQQPTSYDQNGTPSFVSRSYHNMPSNPFEFIYQSFSSMSGSTHTRANDGPQPSPTGESMLQRPSLARGSSAPRRRSSVTLSGLTEENIAVRNYDDPNAEPKVITPRSSLQIQQGEMYHQQERRTSLGDSIWRNVTDMIHKAKGYTQPDGQHQASGFVNEEEDIYFNEDALVYSDMPTTVLENLKEEEESYEFAFADFPRHDGTPCLMYNQQAIFRIASSDDEGNEDHLNDDDNLAVRSPKAKQRQSDNDLFRNMLSQHSMQAWLDGNKDEDDDSIVEGEEDEFNEVTHDSDDENVDDVAPTAESVRSNQKFSEKLNRIMTNRHRQYEKKAIVERHQQTRNERREKYRKDQGKRSLEKHQAMEQALESLEADTFSPLDSTTFMKSAEAGHRRVHSNASNGGHRRSDSNSSVRSQHNKHRRGGSNMSDAAGFGGGGGPMTPKRRDWTRVSEESYGYSPRRPTGGSRSPHPKEHVNPYRTSPRHAVSRSPAPRSPMVQMSSNLPSSAASSPVVAFSGGIFRPSTKSTLNGTSAFSLQPRPAASYPSSFPSDERVLRKSESNGSVSPPGGFEGDREHRKLPVDLPRKRLDQDLALDMPHLSMPSSASKLSNKISPSSVMDDLSLPSNTFRTNTHKETVVPAGALPSHRPTNKHHGGYNFDADANARHGKSFDTIDGRHRAGGAASSTHHSQAYGSPFRSTQQGDHANNSILRTNSYGAPPPGSGSKPSHRSKAGHSRNNSYSSQDDLMLHGIYAKTRFV